MVARKKTEAPQPTGLFAKNDLVHKVGGARYEFKAGEQVLSDTPAKIVAHLERIGAVTPAAPVQGTNENDNPDGEGAEDAQQTDL